MKYKVKVAALLEDKKKKGEVKTHEELLTVEADRRKEAVAVAKELFKDKHKVAEAHVLSADPVEE